MFYCEFSMKGVIYECEEGSRGKCLLNLYMEWCGQAELSRVIFLLNA